jgi:hypothetical protein
MKAQEQLGQIRDRAWMLDEMAQTMLEVISGGQRVTRNDAGTIAATLALISAELILAAEKLEKEVGR